MNSEETSMVLAKIISFDNRNIEEASFVSWHELLEPYGMRDALEAVRDYYRENTRWIMPADVIKRVEDTERERVQQFESLTPSDADLEAGQWSEASRAIRHAARKGHLTHEMYRQYAEANIPFLTFAGTLKAIK